RVGEIRAFANQQVHIGHGIVVIRIDAQSLLQVIEAVFDHGAVLGLEVGLDFLVFQRAGILGLHAHFGASAHQLRIPLQPVDDAQAVVGFLVLRIGLNELDIPILGFVELLDLILGLGNALGFLIGEGGEGGERGGVVRLLFQDRFELRTGRVCELYVFRLVGTG